MRYSGNEQTEATSADCVAHARRKFIETRQPQGKDKTSKADWSINHIQKLYALESKL